MRPPPRQSGSSSKPAGSLTPASGKTPFVDPPPGRGFIVILGDDLPPLRTHADMFALPGDPFAQNLYCQVPNLEWIAANGKVLWNVMGGAVCSPTRSSIHTGFTNLRHGAGTVIGETQSASGALKEHRDPGFTHGRKPLFEVLRAKGVYTGMAGKLHLSLPEGGDVSPPAGHSGLGFTVVEQRLGDPDFARCTLRNLQQNTFVGQNVSGAGYRNYWIFDKQAGTTTQHFDWLTARQFDDAIAFLDQVPLGQPWFLFIAPNATHSPFDWPGDENVYTQEYRELHATFNGGSGTQFSGQMGQMEDLDRNIGRLLDALETRGMRAETTLCVLNDNGFEHPMIASAVVHHGKSWGPNWDSFISGGRWKTTMYRWGTNLQGLILGPEIEPGHSQILMHVSDFYPTIARYFEAEHCEVEGIDMLAALRAPGLSMMDGPRQYATSCSFNPNGHFHSAVGKSRRVEFLVPGEGLFSLVRQSSNPDRLYHLLDQHGGHVDLDEITNLALAEPERLALGQAILDDEEDLVLPPCR